MKTNTHILPLALAQFRRDFPVLAQRLEGMRRGGDSVAVSLRDGGAGGGAPLPEFVTPPSNTGVNKVQPVAQGSKQ